MQCYSSAYCWTGLHVLSCPAHAGIADGLAAGSRRVCWYDRLGYGSSDDAFKPTTINRVRVLSKPGCRLQGGTGIGYSIMLA